MLGRPWISEIELARTAKYRHDFNGPSLAPVHDAVATHDDFANVRGVSFGYDSTRLGKCLEPIDRCHDPTYGQVRIECRIEGDICPNRLKIPEGLW